MLGVAVVGNEIRAGVSIRFEDYRQPQGMVAGERLLLATFGLTFPKASQELCQDSTQDTGGRDECDYAKPVHQAPQLP